MAFMSHIIAYSRGIKHHITASKSIEDLIITYKKVYKIMEASLSLKHIKSSFATHQTKW